jgi:hypothetical protein
MIFSKRNKQTMTALSTYQMTQFQEMMDKQAITEVIYKYCRGIDRMDRELVLSCWHPDGTADYGALFSGLGSGFVDWVWPIHEKMERTQHNITNILIQLNQDKAITEAYWLVYLRSSDNQGLIDIIGGGRYVDHFERLNDVWKIRHRQCIFDWDRVDRVTPHFGDDTVIKPNNPENTTLRGLRGHKDYSYLAGFPTKIL